MQPKAQSCRAKLFKFQKCWLSDPTFAGVVANVWNQAPLLSSAIEKFQKDASLWNRNHFGNIFIKKKIIMAWLNGIQHAYSIRPSAYLINLENELLRELHVILGQEEDLWMLKSRVN